MFETPCTNKRYKAIEYLKRYGRVRYDLEYGHLKVKIVYIQYFG